MKPVVHRGLEYGLNVLVRYRFQWRKTTVGWLQRTTWKKRCKVRLKNIAPHRNCEMKLKTIAVVLNGVKMFLFEKIDKMSNLILCFSDRKKLSFWSSVLFTFSTLEMHEREAYRKQTRPEVSVLLNKVSALVHDRFIQVSLYTVSYYLQILQPKLQTLLSA